ncbi:UNVERIFIED_CONTAM: hypothetical protein Slati_2121100 [Sesamum latifolium]|uniref:Reverse transcriptase zinc-binding domain-containing protein n=1 Tax=Sesamum latifolium TaxID=2727402 RepID=A0AAW2WSQ3_9LAMI
MELYLGLPSKIARSKRELGAELWGGMRSSSHKRIFPHGDIFTAKLGYCPSFTWRSLLTAQPLLLSGCRWRVGSSNSIRIWDDPWIPRPRSCKPITPPPMSPEILKVADLIDPINRDCNVTKVEDLFLSIDRDIILNIPVSQSGGDNLIVWHYSTNGIFSVRSTYQLACELEVDVSCSDRWIEQAWWRKLWQANIPCKVKIFIWCACLNILPTSSNLHRRIQETSSVYPHCHTEDEDDFHAILLCYFAR